MSFYVKKPIPIIAIQWTGDNLIELTTFCNENNIPYVTTKDLDFSIGGKRKDEYKKGDELLIVPLSHYIVITEIGEIKVISDNVFVKIYDEIDSDTVFEFDKSEEFSTIRVLNGSFVVVPHELKQLQDLGVDLLKLIDYIHK